MKKRAALPLSLALVAGGAGATAIQIQTGTYYGTGMFSDGADFQSVVEGAVTTSSWVSSYDNLPVTINDAAVKSTITFRAGDSGDDWTFRAGVDFGKGGAVYLDGVLQQSYGHDMWWANDYSGDTPGNEQFFQFSADGLSVGTHTLTLYGLESCCSGNEQVQYQVGTRGFTSFGVGDGLLPVPEPENAALLLVGLGLAGSLARRGSKTPT